MHKHYGFTLLEMIVVLVLMGIITSLALPGLQKMYDSVSFSLKRDELFSALNSLAFDVRAEGKSLSFSGYLKDKKSLLPYHFSQRLAALNVELFVDPPIIITASGFCPDGGIVEVKSGVKSYQVNLSSPGCRVK